MDRATKRAVKAAGTALSTLGFVWLFGAFISLEINPLNWSEFGRAHFAIYGTIFSGFSALLVRFGT